MSYRYLVGEADAWLRIIGGHESISSADFYKVTVPTPHYLYVYSEDGDLLLTLNESETWAKWSMRQDARWVYRDTLASDRTKWRLGKRVDRYYAILERYIRRRLSNGAACEKQDQAEHEVPVPGVEHRVRRRRAR